MNHQNTRVLRTFLKTVFLLFFLVACNGDANVPPTTLPVEPTPLPPPTEQAPAPTTPPPLVLLVAGPEADQVQVAEFQALLAGIAAEMGLVFEQREGLSTQDLGANVRLVVVMPPASGLNELAVAAPQTQFVAVGVSGLEGGANLTVIGGGGRRADHEGFIAGYLAAVVTEDWRVGIISASDTSDGQAARQGFLEGGRYFCGLCLPEFPPFNNYPLYVEIPIASSPEDWRSAADLLLNSPVKTVYVPPGVGDDSLLEYLVQAGAWVIGSTSPPGNLLPNWVATVSSDHDQGIRDVLLKVLAGEAVGSISGGITITDVNSVLVSPGRQANVYEILAELVAGHIDTGGN